MTRNWIDFGFCRATAVIPKIKLGKPLANVDLFVDAFTKYANEGASIIFTPELALTGYTCEDLFHSEGLIQETEAALSKIILASKKIAALIVIGAPLRLVDGRLLNCAWAIHDGKVIGAVPKISIPNMGEFYERRWFVTGKKVHEPVQHPKLGNFLVSPFQIFTHGLARIGIEICQDLWTPLEPSGYLALKGANLILNLSASNETVGKAAYRKKLVSVQSQKFQCAYLYAGAGNYESSKDTVFAGHTFGYELGHLLGELPPFHSESAICFDLDLERVLNSRTKDICFLEAVDDAAPFKGVFHALSLTPAPLPILKRKLSAYPFLDEIPDFEDVLQIQSNGLLRRLESSHAKTMIVGISGGLDSTLALYVALRARGLSGGRVKVIGVTMPGPGTSERTLKIAKALLEEAGVDQILEIGISKSVTQHLKDIGQHADARGIVYENAQARERTQVLFDLANEHQGIVIGTGDLSELALGWCTFNADHMAHYGVNSGIPKTVVRGLVGYWSEIATSKVLKSLLQEILELPISPELLPPSEDGAIAQDTEALIGSYDLHDFFLYQFLNYGFSREKIGALAEVAFADDPELRAQLDSTLERFFSRFFSQQFKRTTLPPGPKVHLVGLSPRSDFRLPDEI